MTALFGPKWRNWQTRQIQGLVPARVSGFESPLRHQTFWCFAFSRHVFRTYTAPGWFPPQRVQ